MLQMKMKSKGKEAILNCFRLIQLSDAKEEFHDRIEKPMLGILDVLMKY